MTVPTTGAWTLERNDRRLHFASGPAATMFAESGAFRVRAHRHPAWKVVLALGGGVEVGYGDDLTVAAPGVIVPPQLAHTCAVSSAYVALFLDPWEMGSGTGLSGLSVPTGRRDLNGLAGLSGPAGLNGLAGLRGPSGPVGLNGPGGLASRSGPGVLTGLTAPNGLGTPTGLNETATGRVLAALDRPGPGADLEAARAELVALAGTGAPLDPRVAHAIGEITRPGSTATVTVGAIAAQVGLSRPRLRTLVRDRVGVPLPRLRLWAMLRTALTALPDDSAAAAAAIAGFADQSHLTRTARTLAGRTPSEILRPGGRLPDLRGSATSGTAPRRTAEPPTYAQYEGGPAARRGTAPDAAAWSTKIEETPPRTSGTPA